ncbi:type I restriction-modification enzyme R subunit C-terminal domain-containing protein [Streptomyces sp. JJ36]|uniref:type I restriction-modification enzyme R subunit C-terminal domain-containing protein n=1 Tax=Streptomyces sp. JJ36 TaxID=2736645 RepID=UPI001F428CB2|nr:type I restriction-modification enzyme R subunit C-terminal domain-containing protein [Streptomyces sp. JJ36]
MLAHQDLPAVHKLYTNEQITAVDLTDLAEVFLAEGVASQDDLDHVREKDGGLGLFLRRIRGLDRQAAETAFADFMTSHDLSARQMDLLEQIIDYIVVNGRIDLKDLYQNSAFSRWPLDEVFGDEEVDDLNVVFLTLKTRAEPTGLAA